MAVVYRKKSTRSGRNAYVTRKGARVPPNGRKYSVDYLKRKLKKRGLKTSGTYDQLYARYYRHKHSTKPKGPRSHRHVKIHNAGYY